MAFIQAHALLNRWEKRALQEVGWKKENADWTMINYQIVNGNCLRVQIDHGSCG